MAVAEIGSEGAPAGGAGAFFNGFHVLFNE